MELILISLDQQYTKNIAWIEINTPNGNYIIQKGHAPLIIPLSPNEPLTYQLDSGKKETLMVLSGIADIDRKKISIIMRVTMEK